jgi:heme exporter protein D
MIWNSLRDFLAMGGYGPYVWGATGFTLAVLAAEMWLVARRLRRAKGHA